MKTITGILLLASLAFAAEDPYNSDTPANYHFKYEVKDEYSGQDFGQEEARSGYNTDGEYQVLLPDGRRQIVKYKVADSEAGYVADVSYQGEAKEYENYKPTYRPEPVTYRPEPVRPTYRPEPVRPTYRPEPVRPTYRPEPVRPTYRPEPVVSSTAKPEIVETPQPVRKVEIVKKPEPAPRSYVPRRTYKPRPVVRRYKPAPTPTTIATTAKPVVKTPTRVYRGRNRVVLQSKSPVSRISSKRARRPYNKKSEVTEVAEVTTLAAPTYNEATTEKRRMRYPKKLHTSSSNIDSGSLFYGNVKGKVRSQRRVPKKSQK